MCHPPYGLHCCKLLDGISREQESICAGGTNSTPDRAIGTNMSDAQIICHIPLNKIINKLEPVVCLVDITPSIKYLRIVKAEDKNVSY